MQRLMRAAIGTNNIDNCSRVCHSPTSFALRKSLGLSRRDRLVRRLRPRRRDDPDRRQPDRGPPGRRRAHQAGDAARDEARDDRPAPDRARRLRRPAPQRRGPGTNAAVMLGIAHVDPPRRPRRPRLHRRAHRGLRRRCASCSPQYTPDDVEEITGIPAADLERAAHIYGEADERLLLLGPRRDRAQVRLRGRAADLQRRADDRQGRPPRLGAAAAARPEQRPGLVRHGRAAGHVHRLPLGRRRGGRAARSRRRGASRSRARRATRSRRCSTPRSPAT